MTAHRAGPGSLFRGRGKLTEEERQTIARSPEKAAAVAQRYGVSVSRVYQLRGGRRFRGTP